MRTFIHSVILFISFIHFIHSLHSWVRSISLTKIIIINHHRGARTSTGRYLGLVMLEGIAPLAHHHH